MIAEPCPVCAGTPRVLVAVEHATLRRFISQLLAREHGCWAVESLDDRRSLAHELGADPPDLLVVEAGDFPRCRDESLGSFPAQRVVVIGPEPDPAYRHAAVRGGAGGWLPRDCIGEDLSAQMRHALGCTHEPCPARTHPDEAVSTAPAKPNPISTTKGPP